MEDWPVIGAREPERPAIEFSVQSYHPQPWEPEEHPDYAFRVVGRFLDRKRVHMVSHEAMRLIGKDAAIQRAKDALRSVLEQP